MAVKGLFDDHAIRPRNRQSFNTLTQSIGPHFGIGGSLQVAEQVGNNQVTTASGLYSYTNRPRSGDRSSSPSVPGMAMDI
jgi:hypothetical protein